MAIKRSMIKSVISEILLSLLHPTEIISEKENKKLETRIIESRRRPLNDSQ